MRLRSTAAALALVAVSVVVSGCASHTNRSQKEPAMNMQQAGDRAEALLDDTLKAVTPPLSWGYNVPTEVECSTGLNEPTGTFTIQRGRYVTTIVSAQRRGNLLGLVERHWKQRGYRVTSTNPDKDMPAIDVSTPDGFVVSLDVGAAGNVTLSAASPCAAKSQMTFPTGTPGGPGGPQGEPDLRPREHSSFWSSPAPVTE